MRVGRVRGAAATLVVLALLGLSACGQSRLHSESADAPEPATMSRGPAYQDRAHQNPAHQNPAHQNPAHQNRADEVVIGQPKRTAVSGDCAGLLRTTEVRILTGVPVEPQAALRVGGNPAGCAWRLGQGPDVSGGLVRVSITVDDSVRRAGNGVLVRPTMLAGNTARELIRRDPRDRACAFYVRLNDEPASRVGSTLSVSTTVREPTRKAFCPVAHRLAEIAFGRLPDA